MYKKLNFLIFTVVLLSVFSLGLVKRTNEKNRLNKITANDDYKAIDINQIFMWVANNGDGSNDPRNSTSGFAWPGGVNATQHAIFEDGLVWGGKVGREIRTGGSTYNHGLQAGKILDNGLPDDPDLDKYRIYKIRKDWKNFPLGPKRDALEKDFNEWPVEDGAPWVDVDGNGVYKQGVDQPKFVGDEVLWFVANDMDPSRTLALYGTLPFGLETQVTIFGFNRTGDLGDMVFKKYLILNKGSTTIRDMVLGYWSDTDLGGADDDYTGSDTSLSLGYTYNGKEVDKIYGSPCPAVGYDFFQGPIVPGDTSDIGKFLGKWRKGIKNLPMTAFTFYINGGVVYKDPTLGSAQGSIQLYNFMTGKVGDTGEPFLDPNPGGGPTPFVLAGDPVAGTGWYEGDGFPGGPDPGDRRHVMSSGPFIMTPGDSQEVVVGILIARSTTTTLASVTALKRKDAAAQKAYDLDFNLTPAPPVPVLHSVPSDRALTLWWETNSESYDAVDPLISGSGVSDSTYTFQGYQLWQFSDNAGSDATLLATWDVIDTITAVYGNEVINGENITVPKIVGPNLGLQRFINITSDKINGLKLRNGTPYYFGVTSYGVSVESSPTFLESSPVIMEIRPGRSKIDVTSDYVPGDSLFAKQTNGNGDGTVVISVVDPAFLTGDTYKVTINKLDANNKLNYSVINTSVSPNDTLLKDMTDFNISSTNKIIIDGFTVAVYNDGLNYVTDSVKVDDKPFGVKSVVLINADNSQTNVFENDDSNLGWKVVSSRIPKLITDKSLEPLQTIDWNNEIGVDDYEIRFGSSGSEYYLIDNSRSKEPMRSHPKAVDKVPFEIWKMNDDNLNAKQPKRLFIQVWDAPANTGTWDQEDSTKKWDAIFAYNDTNTVYSEPLDPNSGNQRSGQVFGNIIIQGNQPNDGSIIRIITWKPLKEGDEFEFIPKAQNTNDLANAKDNINKISVFPNPYFGANKLERNKIQRFMRFTGLPTQATIRIFSLSGVFVKKIEKNGSSQYVDWNLLNEDNLPVGSGIFIAYIDMPGVGTKVMKLALIQEQQFIDRL